MHAVWDQHIPALHCPGPLACLTRMSQTTTNAFELQNELVGAMNSDDCICVQNTVLSCPNISTATSHARNHEKKLVSQTTCWRLGALTYFLIELHLDTFVSCSTPVSHIVVSSSYSLKQCLGSTRRYHAKCCVDQAESFYIFLFTLPAG